MKKEINDFLEYLEIDRGLSRATLRNYHFYLNRFADFAKNKQICEVEKITEDLTHKYRLYINRLKSPEGVEIKKNTQNYHLIALRAFLKYLARKSVKTLEPEKIDLAKQTDRQVSFLEADDVIKLLKAPRQIAQDEIISRRDLAILELLFSTGLRVGELVKLEIENINLRRDEFSVRGKGGKLRLVFLSDDAKRALYEYLKIRRDEQPFLFVSHGAVVKTEKVGLTSRTIQRIVEKYAKIAGITKSVTPHTLRHSYATDLLINGADIRSVQSMLGHSSITTTQVYTHITDQQLRDVHKAFHGRTRKREG